MLHLLAVFFSSLHRQRGPRHVVRSLLPRVLHVHHRPRRLGHHQGDARSVNGRIRRVMSATRRFTAPSFRALFFVDLGTSSMGAEVFETFVIRPARSLSVVRDAQKRFEGLRAYDTLLSLFFLLRSRGRRTRRPLFGRSCSLRRATSHTDTRFRLL